MALGLFSPFKFEKEEYEKYNITKFRNHIRFMEIIENRNGESGIICPLFFDGAVSYFEELPLPEDSAIENWHNYIHYLTNTRNVEDDIRKNIEKKGLSFFSYVKRENKKPKELFFRRMFNKLKRLFKWQ